MIRRVAELTAEEPGLYVASSSSRTINYKGMLISYQLAAFYEDLRDERTKSALALVHSRFSTNTFPSWELAHPYRVICHNGEINTRDGQRQLDARARERAAQRALRRGPREDPAGASAAGNSDSATFDNVLELLMLAGRSLPHAAMMMIPEAYRDREDLPEYLKGFYAFHSCLMEPWDGPASVAFTDGRVVGATLDRNGLRPGRWVETDRRARRARLGVRPARHPPEEVLRLGRLQPGKLFLVDLERGRIVEDEEVKREVATRQSLWRVVRAQRGALLRAAAVRAGHALRPAAAPAPARVRLHPGGPARAAGADGIEAGRAGRVDGQRPLAGGALRPGAAAVLLLQAAVRPGHQPADRPDPRGHRDEPGDEPGQRAQPVRRDARARPQARAGPADPAQPRARDAPPRLPRGVRGAHDRHHLAVEEGAPEHERGDRADLPPGARGDRRRGQHHHPVRPAARARAALRSRRCWRSPPSTTTWCARARACAWASSSSRASRARCITSRR